MKLKKILALHVVLLPCFTIAAAAQAPVYLSAENPYNAQVTASVDLSYDATRPVVQSPVRRRPNVLPATIDQASIAAATVGRNASTAVLKRQMAAQPNSLSTAQSRPSLLVSSKPVFGATPLSVPRPSLSVSSSGAKIDIAKSVTLTHGFTNHQPVPLTHGFKSPDQKIPQHAPPSFTCCGTLR